ncbi:hypothetical protein CMV_002094 [Castanea mollissima]|uniref:Glycosyltransferase family 28 N-terminal domain-containing protein n=1 Tax=Castanea mollissima TaxID=60419 RepID=A0A8J4RU45_9ROSI|nr:hypothetical protein CMV_002094 [Castanea mollissima]
MESGPREISIQRKHLKAIIESILPACIEPDLENGLPFRAQSIIANLLAYGEFMEAHVAEALGVPLHIFFTMPWTPTYEFPNPFAHVPLSAGYWYTKSEAHPQNPQSPAHPQPQIGGASSHPIQLVGVALLLILFQSIFKSAAHPYPIQLSGASSLPVRLGGASSLPF